MVPGHGLASPVIAEGVEGISREMDLHLAADVPQALIPVTHKLPLTNEPFTASTMELVPCPLTILVFAGGTQLYVVTAALFVTEYVYEFPGHGFASPCIDVGVPGALTQEQLFTVICLVADDVHPLPLVYE